MDDQMMKEGGAIKRAELIEMGLKLQPPRQRDLTSEESDIAINGDSGQGTHLTSARKSPQKIIKNEL